MRFKKAIRTKRNSVGAPWREHRWRLVSNKSLADAVTAQIQQHGDDYHWWADIPVTIRDNEAGLIITEGSAGEYISRKKSDRYKAVRIITEGTKGCEYLSRKKADRYKTGISRPGSGIGPLPRWRGLKQGDLTTVSVPAVHEWIKPDLPDSADLVFALRHERKDVIELINEAQLRRELRPGRITTRELKKRDDFRLPRRESRRDAADRERAILCRFGFASTTMRKGPPDLSTTSPGVTQDPWRRFASARCSDDYLRKLVVKRRTGDEDYVYVGHLQACRLGKDIEAGIRFAAPGAVKVSRIYYPGIAYNDGRRLYGDDLKAAIDNLRPAKKGSKKRLDRDDVERARGGLRPKEPKHPGECATTDKKRVRKPVEPCAFDQIRAKKRSLPITAPIAPEWIEE